LRGPMPRRERIEGGHQLAKTDRAGSESRGVMKGYYR